MGLGVVVQYKIALQHHKLLVFLFSAYPFAEGSHTCAEFCCAKVNHGYSLCRDREHCAGNVCGLYAGCFDLAGCVEFLHGGLHAF